MHCSAKVRRLSLIAEEFKYSMSKRADGPREVSAGRLSDIASEKIMFWIYKIRPSLSTERCLMHIIYIGNIYKKSWKGAEKFTFSSKSYWDFRI